jgi:hypothetical protein
MVYHALLALAEQDLVCTSKMRKRHCARVSFAKDTNLKSGLSYLQMNDPGLWCGVMQERSHNYILRDAHLLSCYGNSVTPQNNHDLLT